MGRVSTIAFSGVLSLLFCCQAACAAEKGWALTQASKLAGSHSVLITPHAVRVESSHSHYIVVCRAPDWQMVLYNPLSKVMFRSPIDKFKGRLAMGSGLFNGNFLEDLPLSGRSSTREKFLGQTAEHFSVLYKHQIRRPHKLGDSAFLLTTRDLVSANYWVWVNKDLPPNTSLVLQKIYKIPRVDGVLLRLIAVDSDNHANVELDTTKIAAQMIQESSFRIPPGLRLVSSEEEVMNDSDRKYRVNHMIENFDDWRDVMKREGSR